MGLSFAVFRFRQLYDGVKPQQAHYGGAGRSQVDTRALALITSIKFLLTLTCNTFSSLTNVFLERHIIIVNPSHVHSWQSIHLTFWLGLVTNSLANWPRVSPSQGWPLVLGMFLHVLSADHPARLALPHPGARPAWACPQVPRLLPLLLRIRPPQAGLLPH